MEGGTEIQEPGVVSRTVSRLQRTYLHEGYNPSSTASVIVPGHTLRSCRFSLGRNSGLYEVSLRCRPREGLFDPVDPGEDLSHKLLHHERNPSGSE